MSSSNLFTDKMSSNLRWKKIKTVWFICYRTRVILLKCIFLLVKEYIRQCIKCTNFQKFQLLQARNDSEMREKSFVLIIFHFINYFVRSLLFICNRLLSTFSRVLWNGCNRRKYTSQTQIADSAQTEYCTTFPSVLVCHRCDISSFLDNLIV